MNNADNTYTNPTPTLTADGSGDTWSVVDANGGRWWPCDEAEIEINASSDPETAALNMARDEPMRGEWIS